MTLKIAHRGASSIAPENTLIAFRKAIELSADMIELDVRQSADGHLVVIHDDKVDRTTDGSGVVGEMSLTELKELDAGSWFNAEFSEERIPTLEEVIDLVRGKVGMVLEAKGNSELYPSFEDRIVETLRKIVKEVMIIGYSDAKARIRSLDSEFKTSCSLKQFQRGLEETKNRFVLTQPDKVYPRLVRNIQKKGFPVIVGISDRTPNGRTRRIIRRLKNIGVDGIICNRVSMLMKELQS
jgi:glycerophosphoryl diester phosphodiesterase